MFDLFATRPTSSHCHCSPKDRVSGFEGSGSINHRIAGHLPDFGADRSPRKIPVEVLGTVFWFVPCCHLPAASLPRINLPPLCHYDDDIGLKKTFCTKGEFVKVRIRIKIKLVSGLNDILSTQVGMPGKRIGIRCLKKLV